ncbi:hypothetical protein H5410_015183 [Solanum commersonii]|uniref:Uncharacterized protein n=1 Tax=Solanum commersonii TaxID=4109 RepID=A0A9J5ZTQ1_SOLCO|nr:hypothetical protein H5410_015183 [Solanum commersonii]
MDLQILNSRKFEVNPTSLNSSIISISKNCLIKSKFMQPKSKMENKSFSRSRWCKNFCRLDKRHKIKNSFVANDVEMESTNL